jgi:hypothetical protein
MPKSLRKDYYKTSGIVSQYVVANNSFSVGQPIRINTSTGAWTLAQADSTSNYAQGLVFEQDASSFTVVFSGPIVLSTAQWDAVAGTTGGLTAGTKYYLSSSSAGTLTNVAPSNAQVVVQAVSSTTAVVLSEATTGSGSGAGATVSFNSATNFAVGTPVYFNSASWQSAQADTEAKTASHIIFSKSGSGPYDYVGIAVGEVTLTTGEWDVITGGSGGLSPSLGPVYYLSSATAGRITTTAPTIKAPILIALSTTKAFVNIGVSSVSATSGGGSSTTFSSATLFAVGTPVYFNGTNWLTARADNDTTIVQYVVSVVTGSGPYNYTALASGEVTLTTGQWDARTGGSGGLVAGSTYYLSSTTAGAISTTPGLILSPVLRALSTTKAFINLSINSIESGMGDTFYRDTTTTIATTTSITLTYPPAGKAYVWLSIDGVMQSGSDFTLAGTTLSLGASVPSGTLIDVLYARAVLLADTNAINKMVAFSETVTGSAKTVFNLPSAPAGANSCIVFVGGAVQDPSKWNLSGNVLTLLDSVAVGIQVVAYILNSSGISTSLDSFVTRATNSLSVDGTVSISTLFGSQTSASYRFFDATDPRISGTVFLKHNGAGSDPDVRVDSNSGSVSITQNTASKLNIYISGNVIVFQNKTANTIQLRVYKET